MNASVWWPSATKRERSIAVSTFADARMPGVDVDEWTLPDREFALGLGRAVVVDRLHREAAQPRRELGGVPDRGAGETERRVRAVVLAQTPEPTQDVRDVAPEHASQRVQLVDDDVPQSQEERRPPVVRRQDPHVQHLGVREQHVRVRADPGPFVGRGVAVVGGGDEIGDQPLAERAQLVLRKCLGREHEQCGVVCAVDHRLHDRQLVTERLAGRGAGRDDDAAPVAERVDRIGLMRPQCVDAAFAQTGGDRR